MWHKFNLTTRLPFLVLMGHKPWLNGPLYRHRLPTQSREEGLGPRQWSLPKEDSLSFIHLASYIPCVSETEGLAGSIPGGYLCWVDMYVHV